MGLRHKRRLKHASEENEKRLTFEVRNTKQIR